MVGVTASAGVRIAHCHSALMLTGSTISQCSITASAISAATSISPAIWPALASGTSARCTSRQTTTVPAATDSGKSAFSGRRWKYVCR